jgi:hypothetical protein
VTVAREGYPHLPPGREPGAQSRRRATGRALGGCAAPAFVVAGVMAAAIVAGFGALLGSLPDGPPSWPFYVGAVAVLAFFWLFARAMWRGRRSRYAGGVSVSVDRQTARRGERVLATVSGADALEVGLVCTEHYDVRRSYGDDAPSRAIDSAAVVQVWANADGGGGLGARVELALPAEAPYSYEGDCVSLSWAVVVRRAGEKRFGEPVPVWVEP